MAKLATVNPSALRYGIVQESPASITCRYAFSNSLLARESLWLRKAALTFLLLGYLFRPGVEVLRIRHKILYFLAKMAGMP